MTETNFENDLNIYLDEELAKRSPAAALTFLLLSSIAVFLYHFYGFFNYLLALFFIANIILSFFRLYLAYQFTKLKVNNHKLHQKVIYLTLTVWSLIFIFSNPIDLTNKYSLFFVIYIQCALVLAGSFTSVVVNKKMCNFLIVTSLLLPLATLASRILITSNTQPENIAFITGYLMLSLYAFKQSYLVRSDFINAFRSEWQLKKESTELAQALEDLKKIQIELDVQRAYSLNMSKNLSLGEMAAGLAHEINNPLAVIIGYSDVIELENEKFKKFENFPSDKLTASLAKIKFSATKIENIIKGLRFFSKTSDAEIFIHTAFDKLLNNTLSFFNDKVSKNSIRIELHLQAENIIYCQMVNLSHVLYHLISNAIDHAIQSEEKTIRIITKNSQSKFIFSIEDSGPGVSIEIENRIFDPFFTTKEVGKGSGLGLSISKGIIESHKGKIYLEDKRRSNFVFEIPNL